MIEQSILNKFCKTFGILIGAGVPVLETTALLRKVVDNKVYERAIDDASDLIRDGYNISTALRRTEVFPSILLQLASTGEDTGELDDLLDRAADYYQKQVDALVDRMTTLIEPLLILMVGAVIALMVVLTYLPVFHLGSALQSGYNMELTLPIFGGIIAGYAVRRIINWLSIDGYVVSSKDPSIELIGVASWSWHF